MNGSGESGAARIDGRSKDRQNERYVARQDHRESASCKNGICQNSSYMYTRGGPHHCSVELMCPKPKQVTSSSIFVPGRTAIR